MRSLGVPSRRALLGVRGITNSRVGSCPLTNDFEAEGRAFRAQWGKPFIGVMYAKLARIRGEAEGIGTDVILHAQRRRCGAR
jgi:hypothetical protein